MKRSGVVVVVLALLAVVAPARPAEAGQSPPVGTVSTLRTYDANAGELPEGLAIDKRGRIYITMPFIGELRRIDPDGTEHLVTHLPTGGGFGPFGLAVDAVGNVYATVVTFDPATQGVYRVTPEGVATRIPGTEAIEFGNGISFGDRGALYVTDSIAGRIWRIPRGGAAELWVSSPLLVGDGSSALPAPIGANGIAYRHRTIYVTNFELGSIVAIPVLPDGSAGVPTVLVQDASLEGADGMALDAVGNLYVAVLLESTVVRIAPDGTELTVLADGADGLDFPSTVAFGTGAGQRKTVYILNFAVAPFFGETSTWGPGLLAMEAGRPGQPQP